MNLRTYIKAILEGHYTGWMNIDELGPLQYGEGRGERPVDTFMGQEDLIVQKLAKHFNIKKTALLGSGTNGFAYYIPNNRVLKVTKDKSEVAEANKIQGKKNKHLANIYGTYTLGGKYAGTYVVISELLAKSEDIDNADYFLEEFFEKEFNYNTAFLFDDYSNGSVSKEEIKDYEKKLKEYYHYDGHKLQLALWYMKGMFGIIDDIRRNGIKSVDWTPVNLGIKKDGSLAMYDLGYGDPNIPQSVDNINLNENSEVFERDGRYQTKDGLSYIDIDKSFAPEMWYVEMIESKKPGNGTILVKKVIEDAKKAGIKKIKLGTTEFSGWGFWDKMGFTEVGDNNDPHDIPMELILNPMEESADEKLYFSETINESVYIDKTNFSTLTDEELSQIAKWGLESEFAFSGCWDDNDELEMAMRCVVDDFKQFINTPYPQGFKNFPTEPVLYRFLTADSKESIKTDNLGESWFADPEHYKNNYDFFTQLAHLRRKDRPQAHKLFLVTARVPVSKIDMARTLWKRSANSSENEVVLKDDSNLKIVGIQDMFKELGETAINEWWSADEYPEFTDGQFNPLFKNRPSPPVMNMNAAPLSETEISQEELNKKDLQKEYPDMFDDFITAKSEAEIREIAPTINLRQNPASLIADIEKNHPPLYDSFAEWIYEKIK